ANITISESFVDQTIEELNLRKKYHLNVIVVLRDDKAISEITPDLVLQTEDILVVGGTNDAIKKFEKANET
ncbi:MAG TPA: TrkA C-terminal domain-containing protein, partial [Sphaerochaeta sp.]|nr:TrkA C-terminal domain-containing protein [Sphaerochaeta sp.]